MFEDILIITLLCWGVRAITRSDSIFSFWENIAYIGETDKLRSYLFEPIAECLTCMSSFWGAFFFFLSGRVDPIHYAHFLISLLTLILIDIIWKDKNQALKYVYLVSFALFIYQVQEFELCAVVILASAGLNHLSCKIVCG